MLPAWYVPRLMLVGETLMLLTVTLTGTTKVELLKKTEIEPLFEPGFKVAGLTVTTTVAGDFQPPVGVAERVIQGLPGEILKLRGVTLSLLVKLRFAVTGFPPACAKRLIGFGFATRV